MIDPFQAVKQQQQRAAQSGMSGELFIDADPRAGFLRLKVVRAAGFDPAQFIPALCFLLTQAGMMFNLEPKVRVKDAEAQR